MKLPLHRSLGVAATVLAALASTTVPAFASAPVDGYAMPIHRVNCDRTDYLEIHNNSGMSVLCFADRGAVAVAIYGVNWIESGNNKAEIQFQRSLNNPAIESVTIEKWNSWNPGHVHKVSRIEIF